MCNSGVLKAVRERRSKPFGRNVLLLRDITCIFELEGDPAARQLRNSSSADATDGTKQFCANDIRDDETSCRCHVHA